MTSTKWQKLSALSAEELAALYRQSKDFQSKVREIAHERNLLQQEREYKNIFKVGEPETEQVVEIHNHYSFFFLATKDLRKLVRTIRPEALGEEAKAQWEICDRLERQWKNTKSDDLGERLERASERLLKTIEQHLLFYQIARQTQIADLLAEIASGKHYASSWETNGKIICEKSIDK